jgi:hypothetical protein
MRRCVSSGIAFAQAPGFSTIEIDAVERPSCLGERLERNPPLRDWLKTTP